MKPRNTFMERIFGALPGRTPVPAKAAHPGATPAGTRIYAIGDVHGRLDLFEEIIAAVEADDAAREPAETTIVLLGDLIDRGADSAGVVKAAREWSERRNVKAVMGNHEEMFLESFSNPGALPGFLRYGGRATLQSYGICDDALDNAEPAELQRLMAEAVPEEDRAFLAGLEMMVRMGDYVFVHAGVRPGLPLEWQSEDDCRWIREPFLSHEGDHGGVVVHGHTVVDHPEILANRIGIDTGAYMSGKLTALCLEGSERRLLQACQRSSGAIVTRAHAVQD